MSSSSSLHEPGHQHRSLRDRMLGIFYSSPPTRSENTTRSRDESIDGSTTQIPDARTRLLESYNRPDPVGGPSESYNHGTFSPPAAEGDARYMDIDSMRDAGNGGSTGLGGAFKQNQTPSGGLDGAQGPENMPSMHSSISGLPVHNHKKLYALGPCRLRDFSGV